MMDRMWGLGAWRCKDRGVEYTWCAQDKCLGRVGLNKVYLHLKIKLTYAYDQLIYTAGTYSFWLWLQVSSVVVLNTKLTKTMIFNSRYQKNVNQNLGYWVQDIEKQLKYTIPLIISYKFMSISSHIKANVPVFLSLMD